MRAGILAALAPFLLLGCATNSNDIAASYVSPLQYDNLTCRQLAEEAERVSHRGAVAAGVQDHKASNDAVATAVAVVVFWPALFFISGDKGNAVELARLKGEMDAIEQVSIRKLRDSVPAGVKHTDGDYRQGWESNPPYVSHSSSRKLTKSYRL